MFTLRSVTSQSLQSMGKSKHSTMQWCSITSCLTLTLIFEELAVEFLSFDLSSLSTTETNISTDGVSKTLQLTAK